MRSLILALIMVISLNLQAYAEETASDFHPAGPPPSIPVKQVKNYAEPAYFWVDDKGVEHVSKKSAIPSKYFDNFANKHPRITAFARGTRRWTVAWVVPVLTLAGGVRSAIGL